MRGAMVERHMRPAMFRLPAFAGDEHVVFALSIGKAGNP